MIFIFVSTDSYPDQHAAAIRHTTIAQGIVESGHTVYFFLATPQNWKLSELEYKGIQFKTFDSHMEDNKILKYYNFNYALYNLKERILEIKKESGVEAIVVYAINTQVIKSIQKLAKREQIKIFHERTELPYIFGFSNSIIGKLRYKIYLKLLIPKFNGLFVITDKLKEFFKPYNANIEKIPTVVDTEFFTAKSNSPFNFSYIAYCGTMEGDKDGISILIQSFEKLTHDFPHHKLVLIGNNSDQDKIREVLNTIEHLKIKEKVVFTGFVTREEMPDLLGNADLLVVSKPDNEQNSGNFPIKVGEYLATGVPVVLTKVGEIPKYIVDGETGFLAMPDSAESFFSKMHEALSNYERAKAIGKKGRELAVKAFDYRLQAQRMLNFIKVINQSNGN